MADSDLPITATATTPFSHNLPTKKRNPSTRISEPVPDLDLKLSVGEGSHIGKSPSLLSLFKSSSLVLSREDREEKKRTRERRARKRMEDRKRILEKKPRKEKPLTTATAAESAALESVAADLAARAIASASQSVALFGALLKIQTLQMHATASNPPIIEDPLQIGQIQSEPIILGGVTTKQSASIDQFPTSPSMLTSLNPESPAKKPKTLDLMTQMPCVRVTGDGPNGKKIEGRLSQWLDGQVVIECHCHGSNLTPAEFVEHAGCADVANPMRNITVFFPRKNL